MDRKKLINIKFKDGTTAPILDVDESNVDDVMEIVEVEGGFKIQLKEEKDVSDEKFGI